MNFLFISELLPIDTFASEVVFYRHFKMLIENGHKIHLLTDQNSYLSRKKDLLPQFHLHILPNRKWYYLPFKPYGLLQKLRFLNYYQFYVKSIIKELIMAQGHATYKSKIDNTLLFSAVKTRPLTSKKPKKIIINN